MKAAFYEISCPVDGGCPIPRRTHDFLRKCTSNALHVSGCENASRFMTRGREPNIDIRMCDVFAGSGAMRWYSCARPVLPSAGPICTAFEMRPEVTRQSVSLCASRLP